MKFFLFVFLFLYNVNSVVCTNKHDILYKSVFLYELSETNIDVTGNSQTLNTLAVYSDLSIHLFEALEEFCEDAIEFFEDNFKSNHNSFTLHKTSIYISTIRGVPEIPPEHIICA